jgi:hypothetical protein
MLILSDADRLWINLDKFGKRILQSPCDRYGAAQGHVEIGRFGIGHGRCRIDGGAGFTRDDLDGFGGQVGNHLRRQSVSRLTVSLPIAINSTPHFWMRRLSSAIVPATSSLGWNG